MAKSDSGLEGVVVAETRLSSVDGDRGRLIIAGDDVEEIAGRIFFEEVAARLMDSERSGAQRSLARGRVLAFERLPGLGDALYRRDGMDALRAATAHLDVEDPMVLAGTAATLAAAWSRLAAGLPPVPPDAARPHAEDYLRMVRGGESGPGDVAALEAYLVAVVDHGLNASTFAARIVASTGSDLVSSVVAALGALKGPLHGGAPGPVLDMLDAIGMPDRAEGWLEEEIAAGRRIMGMGHRIYRVRDPRAAVMERAVIAWERASGSSGRLPLARAVERAAEKVLRSRHPERPLPANVEFYTAVLLDAVGIPRTLFTPTFAVSRIAGWCAHVREQRATGRLIRPASRYVGRMPSP